MSILQNRNGCKAGDKCLFPHNKVDEHPDKKPKKGYYSHKRRESDDKNAVAIVKFVPQLGCVSQDSDALVSQRGKQSRGNPMQKVLGSIRKVRFTQSTLRHASILEKKEPSLGKINVKVLHQRSPCAVKFEDRSHEETERQQRCARSKASNLAKNIYKLKEKDKTTFYLLAEEWVLLAASTKEPEEREFVVDSGASMHMVSKRDLNSAELETMRTSRSPTTVMAANGEVQTREEATENVKESDLFVTVLFLEETPPVLSLWKLCEDHGFSYHWTSGQKPLLTKKGTRIDCKKSNCVPFVVLGLSTRSSTTPTPTSSSSSSQDSVFNVSRYTENPVHERSGSMSKGLRGNRCINQQKPKTKLKMKEAKKHKAMHCTTCRTGCKISEKFWSMKVLQQSLEEPRARKSRHFQVIS